MNLTQVEQLGDQWKDADMKDVATRLKTSGKTANAGNTLGNRMFWVNDYMVRARFSFTTGGHTYLVRPRFKGAKIT